MKKTIATLTVMVLVIACKNHPAAADQKTSIADTAKFYPVTDFFRSQLQYAKTITHPMYRITVINGKKDSAVITNDQLNALAATFLNRNINAPDVKIRYKETVFQDLATKSYTLNYTPIDKQAVIQRIDVLLDEETNNVKRIFIRSQFKKGDTIIMEQCNWKAFKSFQVNRYLQTGNYTATELNYVNWNNDLP